MRVLVAAGNVVFAGPLGAGSVAYVDADQLPEDGEAEIEALVIPEGAADDDRSSAALRALTARVRDALAGLDGVVEIVGGGVAAQLLRDERVPEDLAEGAPAVIVDLTGDPESVAAAVQRVADLGTIVLAGDPAGRATDLDFYENVHVRGLRLVGVPPAGHGEATVQPPAGGAVPPAPAEAQVGDPVAVGAPWYRVSP